ncbi:YggS family pyridoxal phosphate-dependent enzyme [Undibacterium fentianense]|uniref:Pyridoxal phosphate homeostasis protein n=1 Tax=Undibacterium fentianense TaxID=2828728 RepID=A0A941E973_9BURK|nr:YggS family pyridoxal phosphate-dependent enzyme [Undibacterium fentianense]MBR7800933.1 YggS family pyridoxal phosphate-dependent enzyme [Undibacterium fentianense]
MSSIRQNLQAVHEAIALSAARYGRNPTEIALLAVSKTFGPEQVLEAWKAGQRAFGENYLQEGVEKIAAVQSLLVAEPGYSLDPSDRINWHFIGPIQSNKTRPIAEHFSWVHSVDRAKIATRLSEQRPADLPPLQICLQVNISRERSKSGVLAEDLLELALHTTQQSNLELRGLMCVPEATLDDQAQRRAFAELAVLLVNLGERLPQYAKQLDTLSMGMSGDLDAAVAEGSTMLRIGSAIFGKRQYAV